MRSRRSWQGGGPRVGVRGRDQQDLTGQRVTRQLVTHGNWPAIWRGLQGAVGSPGPKVRRVPYAPGVSGQVWGHRVVEGGGWPVGVGGRQP